ncbi:TlpA family protein disulfide reductase [Haloarchaeobius sp. TZWSO28]|uniref:TlpA family protein disulfide reductase n=1 Tax=Haloarchaeobius sp. TZWSO28 TaxID=3446119 RepID=UPI003EBBDE41
MELETMRPTPTWDGAGYEDSLDVWSALADDIVVKVWGGDWCKDCRSQLPDFGAALEQAEVDEVEHYPVEKEDDGSKVGPGVEEYGIEYIPTVVVEDADTGEELARFVEEEDRPIAVWLADQLEQYV